MCTARSYLLISLLVLTISPALAGDRPRIRGRLDATTTADSLHVDYDLFLNSRVDSLTLDLWQPVQLFNAERFALGAETDTLHLRPLPGRVGDPYPYHLVGRASWPRDDRRLPSRLWLAYWGQNADGEYSARRQFWNRRALALGITAQPIIIIGSSFAYYDPQVAGLARQASYTAALYLGLHIDYDRWRLTLSEGGGAGDFYAASDSTRQSFHFMSGTGPYLYHDFGDLEGFRPVVGAGWHHFDLNMSGPDIDPDPVDIERIEHGFGVTVGIADPAGSLTYSVMDLEHFRHAATLKVPIISFQRTTFGSRIDYVELDGRPAWKTHLIVDISTPLRPKDGPLVPVEATKWTWRNYAAIALAAAADPMVGVITAVVFAISGLVSLF